MVVLALDKDQLPRYQKFVAQLRAENIRAELYLGQSGMNAQLKYADKRGSICAVIQGSNEREKGEVAIRDLVLGAELAASTKDRADYLELRAKAQFTVPEAGAGRGRARGSCAPRLSPKLAVRNVMPDGLTRASRRRSRSFGWPGQARP